MKIDISESKHFILYTEEEKTAFSEAIDEAKKRIAVGGIGTLNEKQLHAAIKRFVSPDISCHEIKAITLPGVGEKAASDKLKAGSRFVADIFTENGYGGNSLITEIQTGSFFPLRDKIQWYLENTNFDIEITAPVAYAKYTLTVDTETGETSYRKIRSKGNIADIAGELFWVKDFVGNPRFRITLMFIDVEDRKTLKIKRGRFVKRELAERIPLSAVGYYTLYGKESYSVFLPESLKGQKFTASRFAKETGIRGKATYSVLKILCDLGIVSETGEKQKRSTVYFA